MTVPANNPIPIPGKTPVIIMAGATGAVTTGDVTTAGTVPVVQYDNAF